MRSSTRAIVNSRLRSFLFRCRLLYGRYDFLALLGAVYLYLRAFLLPSWPIFGPSWDIFGAFLCPAWPILGSVGDLLGPTWGYLGPFEAILGHLEAFLRTRAFKRAPAGLLVRKLPNLEQFWGPMLGTYWATLGHAGATSSTSSGSKMAQEEP